MARCGDRYGAFKCALEEGHTVDHYGGNGHHWAHAPETYEILERSRSMVYGDPLESHIAIGLAWEGIFRNRYQDLDFVIENHVPRGQLFPPDLVALMEATFKNVRAARPVFHKDSYDDAHVYLNFSERFRQGDAHVAQTRGSTQDQGGPASVAQQQRGDIDTANGGQEGDGSTIRGNR